MENFVRLRDSYGDREGGLERYSGRQKETGKQRDAISERHWETEKYLW